MLVRLGGLFLFAGIALWLWAVFDSLTAPAERVRLLPKGLWVIAVLLFSDVGAIAWFLFGRPKAAARVRAGGGSSSVGPDDDPEFLRRLAEDVRRRRDEPA
jgi:hypothetical protein